MNSRHIFFEGVTQNTADKRERPKIGLWLLYPASRVSSPWREGGGEGDSASRFDILWSAAHPSPPTLPQWGRNSARRVWLLLLVRVILSSKRVPLTAENCIVDSHRVLNISFSTEIFQANICLLAGCVLRNKINDNHVKEDSGYWNVRSVFLFLVWWHTLCTANNGKKTCHPVAPFSVMLFFKKPCIRSLPAPRSVLVSDYLPFLEDQHSINDYRFEQSS